MDFNPFIPAYNVETLFKTYSTCSLQNEATSTEALCSESILAVAETSTQYPLHYTEVAAQCGYNNESSLILIYEKRLKTTPHIFRTGYRIINTNYTFNRHGYSNHLYGEKRAAKNKVYSKK